MDQTIKLSSTAAKLREKDINQVLWIISFIFVSLLVLTGFAIRSNIHNENIVLLAIFGLVVVSIATFVGYYVGKIEKDKIDNTMILRSDRLELKIGKKNIILGYSEIDKIEIQFIYLDPKASTDWVDALVNTASFVLEGFKDFDPNKDVLLEIHLQTVSDKINFFIDGVSYNNLDKFVNFLTSKLVKAEITKKRNGKNLKVQINNPH